MKKLIHKSDKFYRVLLFVGGFLYLLFIVFFQQIPQVQDPIPLGHRGIGALIFFSIFFSSFFITWIKQRLDQLTRLAAASAIVHMIIINHITGYNFTMAVSLIVVVIFTNLIFKGDKLALYSNGILAVLVGISLFLAKIPPAFRFTYFLAYTSSAGLTYYISLSKLREEIKMKNINQKQDILLNTIDTKIWYLTDKDAYGQVNQPFAEFLGREKAEVEYKKIKEVLPKGKAANCIKENELVFKTKEKLQIERWMVNSAGESRLLSITKKPKVNKEGEVEYVVCSAQDITEIKKKEKELRNNRDLLSSILELQNNLVILLNPEGEIVKFNRACEQVLGYSYEEVKNKKIWDILIKEDEIAQTKEVFKTLKSRKNRLEYENYLKTKKGESRLISWNNNVLLDKNNEIKYVVATGNDITEKNWREKILKKSQEIANVGSWELHLKHNQLIWSDETYRIFGLAPQEFEATYEAFLQAIHPDDRGEV
ncbi:MAG: PAS domain-containing protein, partial [Bacillota bacterium]